MMLTQREEALINVVRALPGAEADRVLAWANQLADLANGRQIEWSNSWTDQDIAEATAASVKNLELSEDGNC